MGKKIGYHGAKRRFGSRRFAEDQIVEKAEKEFPRGWEKKNLNRPRIPNLMKKGLAEIPPWKGGKRIPGLKVNQDAKNLPSMRHEHHSTQ